MSGYNVHIHHYFKDEREENKREIPDREIISRLLKYVFPYRKRMIIAIVAIITLSITNLMWPKFLQVAIDDHIIPGDFSGLSLIAIILIILKLINWVSGYVQRYQIYWIGQTMLYKIRKQMFDKLQDLSFNFYDKSGTGAIVSRVTNDTDNLGEMLVQGAVDVLSQMLTLILIIFMMLSMSIPLTLACMITVPLLMAGAFVFRSKFKRTYRNTRIKIAKITSKLEEGILGIRETQSYTREETVMEDFRQANMENLQANLQISKLFGLFRPIIEMIGAIGTSVIIIYGSFLYLNGEITIGILIAFPIYLQMFFSPIINLTLFYNTIQSAMAAAERIFGIIDTDPEIKDTQTAIKLPLLTGEIIFEDVNFGYSSKNPVLENINFKVEAGKTLALVGPTGAGKSTITKLLCRFYEPQSGKITVDGYNIKNVKQKSFRTQMGIVLQETFLFSETIKENIRYGKLDATEEEIVNAAKKVGAHEFITFLPEGYDTHVGERGSNLSVGQKQLISFARAILRNPPIIILDEATSSIDPYTELIIKKSLSKMLKKRTSIVIAHRLSTVRNADEILVINKGRIVERGNHEDLIKYGKIYRRLYEMQFKDIDVTSKSDI